MDRRLMERAMAGDREAFNELARQAIGRLYGLAQPKPVIDSMRLSTRLD